MYAVTKASYSFDSLEHKVSKMVSERPHQPVKTNVTFSHKPTNHQHMLYNLSSHLREEDVLTVECAGARDGSYLGPGSGGDTRRRGRTLIWGGEGGR